MPDYVISPPTTFWPFMAGTGLPTTIYLSQEAVGWPTYRQPWVNIQREIVTMEHAIPGLIPEPGVFPDLRQPQVRLVTTSVEDDFPALTVTT